MTRSAEATDTVKRFVSTEESESGYRNSTGTEKEEEENEEEENEEEENEEEEQKEEEKEEEEEEEK